MKVQIWDSYALSNDGRVLHFDIVVPESTTSAENVLQFGRDYLKHIGFSGSDFNTSRCQFCHVEEPSEEMIINIKNKSYDIIDLGYIEPRLPSNPTRRAMILFLRAFYDEYRFFNFSETSTAEIENILAKRNS